MVFKLCCSMTVCIKLDLREPPLELASTALVAGNTGSYLYASRVSAFLGPFLHFMALPNEQSMRSRVRDSEAETSRNSSPTIAEQMIADCDT